MNSYNQIIEGVRKNEKQAQMAFYDMFFHPVFQSAFAILGDHEEAEEIMQDSLLKIFFNTGLLLDDFHAMMRFLKRIATNQAIDVVRKRKNFLVFTTDDEQIEQADEEDDEEYELSITDIKEAINHLSPVYHSIISLRLFEEMNFAEIASHLNINASTVRVQYSRGIAKLKTVLKQKIYTYE
jgi:RNA polymerase sigma-70 factor (ECF subfamily)